MKIYQVPAVVVIVLAFASLTACAPSQESAPSTADISSETSEQGQAIADLFSSVSADYNPSKSPKELAAISTLVIKGSILRLQEGRVDGDPDDQIVDATSIIVVISDPKVVKGELPEGSDGLIYVEVQSPYNRPSTDYATALPKDTKVVLYLVPAGDGSDIYSQLQDPSAGRPTGQALYMPTNPQSFAVELSDGSGLTWIGESGKIKKGKLDDALPTGGLIPLPS